MHSHMLTYNTTHTHTQGGGVGFEIVINRAPKLTLFITIKNACNMFDGLLGLLVQGFGCSRVFDDTASFMTPRDVDDMASYHLAISVLGICSETELTALTYLRAHQHTHALCASSCLNKQTISHLKIFCGYIVHTHRNLHALTQTHGRKLARIHTCMRMHTHVCIHIKALARNFCKHMWLWPGNDS